MDKAIINEYFYTLKTLFDKDYLSIGVGSLSIKLHKDAMIINRQNSHYKEEIFFKQVSILKKSIVWEAVNIDSAIHAKIYSTISSAKAVAHLMPKSVIAYSLKHYNYLNPINPFIKKEINKIPIIEKEENQDFTISKYMQEYSAVILKGYGLFIRAHSIKDIAKIAYLIDISAYTQLHI